MVNFSIAKKWNLKEFKYFCEDPADPSRVTKIKCLVCSEFYEHNAKELDKLQGQVKIQVKKWIDGSCTVKKNNAFDHLKSNTHNKAVQRLKEKQIPTTGQEIAQSSSTQKTIVEHA